MAVFFVLLSGLSLILGFRSFAENMLRNVLILAVAGPFAAIALQLIGDAAREHWFAAGLVVLVSLAWLGGGRSGHAKGGQGGGDHHGGTSLKKRV